MGLFFLTSSPFLANAQITSASDYLVAQPIPDRTLVYALSKPGLSQHLEWGLDTAWPSEENIRRGVAFMGADGVDVVRVSFQPTHALVNGTLHQEQINWINRRLELVSFTGPNTRLTINSDHPSVDPWYAGNAARWAQLMDLTTRRYQQAGRTVVSIAPFNEPDFGWGQGTIMDFYNICGELRKNPLFDNIRISGPNTLNNDQALPWYNQLKARLDEGNTHQLAGSFDTFAEFYEVVRANGHHASGDELHNVMEAMVGAEYGMQTGIWWGTAELARGEFVKASDGERLAYAEHRPNWTAASVYRAPDGRVQAFGGTSERQAVTTTYRYVSKEQEVYYDGQGPQREFTLTLPGGTGYQQGQTNAERVINISWGDDIQPVINGQYVLVNRGTGKVMEVADGAMQAGANLQQGNHTGATHQQWQVTPVDARIGGDFSYFSITALHSGKAPDILNFSLENGANIIVWDDTKSGNQQWYLDYAGDGWFYIRSRHSAKCLEVAGGSAAAGANIQQWEKTGATHQQWRFLPLGAAIEFTPPSVSNNLTATAREASVLLEWGASPETDVAGYTILRSQSAGGPYHTLARKVQTTAFVDNTVVPGTTYFYVIRAVDQSLNRSNISNEVSATASGAATLVAHYAFDGGTKDSTRHLFHGAAYQQATFGAGKRGAGALVLDGATDFVQLPATLSNLTEITVAAWVNWNSGAAWQRIFDFGNGETEYLYLTPSGGSGQLTFAIRSGEEEQVLTAPALPVGTWTHVAVTLADFGAYMYVNGELAAIATTSSIRPAHFQPVLNYIGRSQFADPLLDGMVDDFRVYNYALDATEVAELAGAEDEEEVLSAPGTGCLDGLRLWPVPASDVLHLRYCFQELPSADATVSVLDQQGQVVMQQQFQAGITSRSMNVSGLPVGVYLLRCQAGAATHAGKFAIVR